MKYVILLLRWTAELIFRFCGLILISIILAIILLASKIYDLLALLIKSFDKYMATDIDEEDDDDDDTDDTE